MTDQEIQALFQSTIDLAKERKASLLTTEEGRLQGGDITPILEVYRGDAVLLLAFADRIDRDVALHGAHLTITGFEADTVRLTLDAHVTNSPTNPRTGREWGPGEMQALCDNEGACDLGLITDTLSIVQVDRSGSPSLFASIPYHVHKSTGTVRWIEESNIFGEGFTGLVPNAIRRSFETPTLSKSMARGIDCDPATAATAALRFGIDVRKPVSGDDFGLSPSETRAHMDMAIARVMLQLGWALAISAPDEEYRDIMTNSLSDAVVP